MDGVKELLDRSDLNKDQNKDKDKSIDKDKSKSLLMACENINIPFDIFWNAYDKKKGGKGFVKGVKFMEQGLEETAKEIPEMAQDMLDRVLSDVK